MSFSILQQKILTFFRQNYLVTQIETKHCDLTEKIQLLELHYFSRENYLVT